MFIPPAVTPLQLEISSRPLPHQRQRAPQPRMRLRPWTARRRRTWGTAARSSTPSGGRSFRSVVGLGRGAGGKSFRADRSRVNPQFRGQPRSVDLCAADHGDVFAGASSRGTASSCGVIVVRRAGWDRIARTGLAAKPGPHCPRQHYAGKCSNKFLECHTRCERNSRVWPKKQLHQRRASLQHSRVNIAPKDRRKEALK